MARKYYTGRTVAQAGRERMRWLLDEFPSVLVAVSGGKDSTAVLHLAREAAEAAGRLPLDVLFVDQEAEWGGVIEYMRQVRDDTRFRLHWLQFPTWLTNASSEQAGILNAWAPGVEWMRDREPDSVHVNDLGAEDFYHVFDQYFLKHIPGAADGAIVCGLRSSEAPRRQILMSSHFYKWVTWGWTNRTARIACPIYDWSTGDVWRFIHETGEAYCGVYDAMYRYGVPLRDMRISTFSHAVAVYSLSWLQEIEPDTWERYIERVQGVNGSAHLRDLYDPSRAWYTPKVLPQAFATWLEYREYLLVNLIRDPDKVTIFRRMFRSGDRRHFVSEARDGWLSACCRALIWNDWRGKFLANFSLRQGFFDAWGSTK